MNLLQQLESSVRIHGSEPCLLTKRDGSYHPITYAELWQRIQSFAAGLKELGIGPGDKVGLLSTNRPEWPIVDYAAMYLQAVVVPVYPTLPPAQVRYILENADVRSLVVENTEQLQKVEKPWPDKLESIICMDLDESEAGSGIYMFSSIQATDAASVADIDIDAIPDTNITTIVHTSGTSGQPKGVMLTHRNLVSNIEGSLTLLPIDPNDITLSYLPLSHIFERTVGQYAPLSRGATIGYAESIETIPQNLTEVRPTVLITVPRLLEKVYSGLNERVSHLPNLLKKRYERVLRDGRDAGWSYHLIDRLIFSKVRKGFGGRVRAIVSGGAALEENIACFYTLAGLTVYEGYGMTESAPVIAANPMGKARPGTVGQPIPGVRVKLAEDGELLVKGPNVMLGYYRQPDETAEVLTEDGWLHTGDIAVIEDGYIRIVERKKNILVLASGKNVAPWPIESAMTLHPHIASAVLIGDGYKYVTALVVPDFAALKPLLESNGLSGSPEELIQTDFVRRTMRDAVATATEPFAMFERPKRIALLANEFTIESGDLTPSLKVRNRVILKKYHALIEGIYAGENYVPIFDDLESAPKPTTTTEADAANAAAAAKAAKKQSFAQRAAKQIGKNGLLLIGLAAVGLAALSTHLPGQLDLVGTIQHIDGNTNKINQVNGHIVDTMKSVYGKAAKTGSIHDRLIGLNQGIAGDQQRLSNLNLLSQNENTLSAQFLSVADSLTQSIDQIANASKAQNTALSNMSSTAASIDQQTKQLALVNQQIGDKLAQANAKTDTLANEMP